MQGRRFFLHLSQKAPHAPATAAPRHLGLFSGIAPFRPPNWGEPDVSDKPAWVQSITWDARGCDTCPAGTTCDACQTDKFRRKQLEALQAVDEGVAAIMQALRDIGQDANTLVIYTSDNGYSWGSHRWKPKQCPYEECMRVPLVVRDPVLAPAPRTEAGPGLNIDYAELIAELTGALPDPGVEGRSLKRLLCGIDKTWRTDILNEHWNGVIPTNAQVRGVFGGKTWKYVEYDTGESELYDLDADPSELNNVTGDPANSALKGTLATRLRQIDPMWPPPPAPMAVQVRPGPDYENDDEFD
jgi:hypothetical protein